MCLRRREKNEEGTPMARTRNKSEKEKLKKKMKNNEMENFSHLRGIFTVMVGGGEAAAKRKPIRKPIKTNFLNIVCVRDVFNSPHENIQR